MILIIYELGLNYHLRIKFLLGIAFYGFSWYFYDNHLESDWRLKTVFLIV